ncbi:MAG TPA: M48 family metalloprotease [Egibacteraceae bacterium]|nr:M48 family metalloprotease [Egibacteraceae bacterium]
MLTTHAVAGLVVAAGLLAQVVRPVAPDLGPAPPAERWFDASYLGLADAYNTPRYAVGVVALALAVLVPCAAAGTRPGRGVTDRLVAAVGDRRPGRAAAVVVAVVVAATDVARIPLAFWVGYLHEGAYGLRTQGVGGWAYDWVVGHVPGWLAAAGLALVGYPLARRLPRAWPAVGGLGAAAAWALVVFAGPVVLEPLWLRTWPLPPGPVRGEVQRVLDGAGVRVEAILVADASRRTTRQNAYLSGLGATRRVVLFDTLVQGRSPQEVGLVLAHELGHQRNADIGRAAMLAAAGAVATAYALAGLTRARVRWGRQATPAAPRCAALLVAAVAVLSVASLPAQALVSRRAEAAADLAALELTGDPQTYLALQRSLARVNLADPAPPRWAYLLWWTHPPATARLELGERWDR